MRRLSAHYMETWQQGRRVVVGISVWCVSVISSTLVPSLIARGQSEASERETISFDAVEQKYI